MQINKKLSSITYCVLLFILVKGSAFSQLIITDTVQFNTISLHPYATYFNAKEKELTLKEITSFNLKNSKPIPRDYFDLGFTHDNYYLFFEIDNATSSEKEFYLEAIRPIVDYANLYIIEANNIVKVLKNGDLIRFKDKNFGHRKTIFKLQLKPYQKIKYVLHFKSDGEVMNTSLFLKTSQELLENIAFEEVVFGYFYGILLIAFILYLFFYFAIKLRVFLVYCFYVLCIGLLQFSLDGYTHQLLDTQGGWWSKHSVLFFAGIANFFLGWYAFLFLEVKSLSKTIAYLFYGLFTLDILFVFTVCFTSVYPAAYPIANVLGLFVLLLILVSIVKRYQKTNQLDYFFLIGILSLIIGFVIFILKNFGILPLNFITDNSSKLGTGIEVIFLSLSLANYLKKLRDEKEQLQDLAIKRAEDMNELKTYFLSNISHELRTPLNSIINLTKVISKETTQENVETNAAHIKYASYNLLSAIDDILDFSKIEKKQITLENKPFIPKEVISHFMKGVSLKAKTQGLDLTFQYDDEIPYRLEGDSQRLLQILNNILGNALKFTQEGTIKCKIEYNNSQTKKDIAQLKITVSDTGIGISKEKLHSIYESFSQQQIDNKRKYGGLGLGLFIVKNLVHLQNGDIKINSTEGLGTICVIELPYKVLEEKQTIIPQNNISSDFNGATILVVEDNAMNQMVIKMMAKKWDNCIVEYANNGKEALDKMLEKTYSLILMDLQMPVMDGYEATIAIRKGEVGNKDIPIIAVTADTTEETKQKVKEIGMNDYITKPIDKNSLETIMKALLNY